MTADAGLTGRPKRPGQPDQPGRPERPIEADWLALRRPVDTAAREPARVLLAELAAWLTARRGAQGSAGVHVFDLGAGTGANQAYLAPRLPFASRWTLLDHDPELLSHPGHGPGERVVAGIADLPRLLDTAAGGNDDVPVVTCSALLDLLTAAELDVLADALASRAVPALFALTVTGQVHGTPADPSDDLVTRAFDAHQGRSGRPGPAATAYLRSACAQRGLRVHGVPTPWHIDTGDTGDGAVRAFALRWLEDYAAAAREQASADAASVNQVNAWADRRAAQARAGTLTVTVGHEDLLILPDMREDLPGARQR